MLSKISNHKLRVFIILALLTTISGCRELSESLEPGEDKNLKTVNREKPNSAEESAKITVDPDSDKLTEEKNAPVVKQTPNTASNSDSSTNQTTKENPTSETTLGGGCSANPAETEIFVYADVDYKGKCVKISKVGSEYPNMDKFGIPNDSISSIKVGSKVQVEICEHNDYEGICQTLSEDESDLDNSDVGNDSISSIRVLGKD